MLDSGRGLSRPFRGLNTPRLSSMNSHDAPCASATGEVRHIHPNVPVTGVIADLDNYDFSYIDDLPGVRAYGRASRWRRRRRSL
jgi:hypothetical protein